MPPAQVDTQFIIRSFSESKALGHYREAVEKIGLWPSESIVFSTYLKADDAILDIGCGAGRTTIGLFKAGFARLTGLDISWAMIREASAIANRLKALCEFAVGDARLLPFGDRSFDGAIFSFNGLMQIAEAANRLRTLQEVRRVVKLGGPFIFTTGERTEHKFWRQQRKVWDQGRQDPRLFEFGDVIIRGGIHQEGYLHFPSIEEMKSLIDRSGWRLLGCRNRKAICKESKAVDRFAGHCLFWVLSNQAE